MKKDFSFIFLAHTHGYLDDNAMLNKAIHRFNPAIIYHEQLEDGTAKSEETVAVRDICTGKDLRPIDLKKFGLTEKHIRIIKTGQKPDAKTQEELNNILQKREKQHLKTLSKAEKRPVLVVLGAWHLRKESPIRKKYSHEKFILVKDKENKECLEPLLGAHFDEIN